MSNNTENTKAQAGSLERMVRRSDWENHQPSPLVRLCIFLSMLRYKYMAASFPWQRQIQSTIVPASPLLLYAYNNNVNANQLRDILGRGKLRGWLSPELTPQYNEASPSLFRIFLNRLGYPYNIKRTTPNDQAERPEQKTPENLTQSPNANEASDVQKSENDAPVRSSVWLGRNFSYQNRQHQSQCRYKQTNIGKVFSTILTLQKSDWLLCLYLAVVFAACLYGMICQSH